MFVFSDAANVSNMNVSNENVEMTEMKIESDELFSAGIITNMACNNSRQGKVVLESKKYVLKFVFRN